MSEKDASRDSIVSELAKFLSKSYSCAMRMFENASYVETELAKLDLPQGIHDEVSNVCATWVSNKHDIISELDDFNEIPAIPESEMIQARVARISTWLSEDFPQLNALVVKLRDLSEQDPKFSLAYALVAESAINVLRSFGEVRAAADRYFGAVGTIGSN